MSDKMKLECDIEIEVQAGVRMLMIPPAGIPNGRYHMTLEPIEPELKPCPFCSGTAPDDVGIGVLSEKYNLRIYVSCAGCGARGGCEINEPRAIAAWNRRLPMEPWMRQMRTDYERDLARERLARYTLGLLALAVLVVWVATRVMR